jgi:hypothetical protein
MTAYALTSERLRLHDLLHPPIATHAATPIKKPKRRGETTKITLSGSFAAAAHKLIALALRVECVALGRAMASWRLACIVTQRYCSRFLQGRWHVVRA